MAMLPLFKTLQDIKDTIVDTSEVGKVPYLINTIRDAIIHHTMVDRIEYLEIDDQDNPIWGRFEPYYAIPTGAYTEPELLVEVHFIKELNDCKSRYVACKEMCHAFTSGDIIKRNMAQVRSEEELLQLVDLLIKTGNDQQMMAAFPPMLDENFASLAALQILCPVEDRIKLNEYMEKNSVKLGNLDIAHIFKIPVVFVPRLMDPLNIAFAEQALGLTDYKYEDDDGDISTGQD